MQLTLQVMKLRQAKNELERKVQDQEDELDEQAGTIQQLEQVQTDFSCDLLCCVRIGLSEFTNPVQAPRPNARACHFCYCSSLFVCVYKYTSHENIVDFNKK